MNVTLRRNWDELKAQLDEQGITSLYHFTDRRNLASIIENGGLYSWQDCLKYGITVERPGGNEVSHSLDVHKHLENYVRLSFVKNHPMMYIAQDDDRELQPVVLEISTHVLSWIGTKFSDRNATKNDVQVRSDLSHIHFDVLKHKAVFDIEDEDQQQFYQAEVLVENCVPLRFIKNLNAFVPDLVKKWNERTPEEKFLSNKKIAGFGNPTFIRSLAIAYHKGYGTDIDLLKAEEYYLKFAALGAPGGYRLASDIYLEKKDEVSFAKAMQLLELGAKMPDGMRCSFKIARLKLLSATDIDQIPSLIERLKKFAMYHRDDLYFMYRLFHGGCKSKDGIVLVNKDSKLALNYLQQTAELNHPKAVSLLAQYYHNKEDKKNAYKWYLRAAKLGDKEAYFYAGYYSKDIDNNYEQAIHWYQKSVDAGSSAAMNNLAIMYENGEGVDEDANRAFELYHKAAESKNAIAMNNVAICYEDGIGTEINLLKSFQWRIKSAQLGNADAIRQLIEEYQSAEHLDADEEESIRWIEKLSQTDDIKAEEVYRLVECYRGKDNSKFQQYLEQSAQLKHRGALIELERYEEIPLYPYEVENHRSNKNVVSGIWYSEDNVYAYSCDCDIEIAVVKEGTIVIASECFSEKEKLTQVVLPSSVKIIGERSFAECKNLTLIKNQSPFFTTINDCLLSKDLKRLITYFGADEEVEVPYGVEIIDEAAFSSKRIKRIILPDTIQQISKAAFYHCEYLEKITIPNRTIEFGEYAFEGCKSLSKIRLPNIEKIPDGCFRDSGIQVISMPHSLKTIGSFSFCNCKKLENVKLNEGLIKIETLCLILK